MIRHLTTITTLSLALGASPAVAGTYSHADYFAHYEGTATCLKCHEDAAKAFFSSQHYQWQGESPAIVNANRKRLGKLNTINDFCTNPKASWIGLERNSRGEVVSKGCSACHAGFGLLPDQTQSAEQLANIDCLICHAAGYRRDLYPTDAGGFEWRPILWKNQEGLDSVSKRISLPTRTMCLRCHSASGGGANYKRGDLEYTLTEPERDFDVHMSPDGGNLQCVDCHAGSDHRVRGRGVDLAGSDSPGNPLSCADGSCHTATPHAQPIINRHARRVDCTVCHIPTFAKDEATDVARDWSTPVYDAEADKYSATITLASDVEPVIAWSNGTTWAQLLGQPVAPRADGTVAMMLPQGTRSDPTAKLHAFKLHRGKLPLLSEPKWVVPIVVERFFADGDIDRAVRQAAEETYGLHDASFTWVDTIRYMGIYHEVVPADQALGCLDCHGDNGRLDWAGLGYERDPLEACTTPE